MNGRGYDRVSLVFSFGDGQSGLGRSKMKFGHVTLLGIVLLVVVGCGKRDGLNKQYFPGGQVKAEVMYQNGLPNGQATLYHENGKVMETMNYVNGKKEGKATAYDSKGRLEATSNYKYGKYHGINKEFHSNGKVKAEIRYKHGKIQGPMKLFYENGKVYKIYNYVNGLRQGEAEIYERVSGELKQVEIYKDDKLKMRKSYDMNGNVTGAEHF